MKRIRLSELPSQRVPRGRFLYRESDLGWRYSLYGHKGEQRVWISAVELGDPHRAAGPFEPADGVRALRLANVEIPNGCELGPWQDGLGFFDVSPLPGHPDEWDAVDPAWLEPSVAVYGPEDIQDLGERACCAPPSYPPQVIWDDEDVDVEWEAPPDLLDFALEPIYRRYPALREARLGSLAQAWNAHPELSLVWAPTGALGGGFYVADFEFPEGIDFGHPRSKRPVEIAGG